MQNQPVSNKQAGFSLVELAIVMVIIGLIVSAIAVGSSTMNAAKTQKFVKQCVTPAATALLGGQVATCTNAGTSTTHGCTLAAGVVTCLGAGATDTGEYGAKAISVACGSTTSGGAITGCVFTSPAP